MSEVKEIKNGIKGVTAIIAEYTDESYVDVSKLPEDAQKRIYASFNGFMRTINEKYGSLSKEEKP